MSDSYLSGEILMPAMANSWFLESLGSLSAVRVNTLKRSLVSMTLELDKTESPYNVRKKFIATLVIEDDVQGLATNAIRGITNSTALTYSTLIRIGIGSPLQPHSYLNLTECKLLDITYSLDYAKSEPARYVLKFEVGDYERTVD